MTPNPPSGPTREFKVHIPLALHFELHRHRLMTGSSISHTVAEALDVYLDRHVSAEATAEALDPQPSQA